VKTVADRHKLVSYNNKHFRWAVRGYQHRWHWTTLHQKYLYTKSNGIKSIESVEDLLSRRSQRRRNVEYSFVIYSVQLAKKSRRSKIRTCV